MKPKKKLQTKTKVSSKTLFATLTAVIFIMSVLVVASIPIVSENIRNSIAAVFSKKDKSEKFIKGQILVKFKDNISAKEQDDQIKKWGFSVKDEIKSIKVKIISVPENAEEALVNALSKNPRVEFVEVDALIPPSVIPNDTDYSKQWHLPVINAPAAWDTTQGQGTIIGIADTAVDKDHPDLLNNLLTNLGYNFYHNNTDYDAYYTNGFYDHGTYVAGVAGAVGNNGRQVAGVAHQVKIIPMRVADNSGYGCISCMARGMEHAVNNGARAINFSFDMCNPDGYPTIKLAAENAFNKGMLTIIGAGNQRTRVGYKADDTFICVSGTTKPNAEGTEILSGYSSYGSYVDISAPMENIYSTAVGGSIGPVTGTSFAAPIVTGTVALIANANPGLTASQIRQILFDSAKDLGTTGWDEKFGWGRVDAAAAVALALTYEAPAPDTQQPTATITAPANGATVSGYVSIDISANDNVGVARVDLYMNGSNIATDNSSPYSFGWNTAGYANGNYTFYAKAYDSAGNAGASSTITLTVANAVDEQSPTISLLEPADGATISSNFNISANATDNVGVKEINIMIDNKLVNACYDSSSCSQTVNLKGKNSISEGAHTIRVTASDVAGNIAEKQISVIIGSSTGGSPRKK